MHTEYSVYSVAYWLAYLRSLGAMRVKKLVAFKGREDRGMPGDTGAKSAANTPTSAPPQTDDTRARIYISLRPRHTLARSKSPILGQANCPEIGEATQFARPTTFGLGHLAYCGALEMRAQSLFIVRRSCRWGALGP